MTEHIQLDISESIRDYHQRLRRGLCSLVAECQRREGRSELHILDVGCGRGELLLELRALGAHVSGVDIEPQCVALSSQYGDVQQGSIYDLRDLYRNEQFDIVIASHVLEHLEAPKQGVEALKAVTRKYLILAVPNLAEVRNLRLFARNPGYVNRGHQVGWDAPHFNTFLTFACGLKVEQWQADRVYLPRRLSQLLQILGMLHLVQDHWLPKWLPLQTHSLIVLCTKQGLSSQDTVL